MTNDRLDAMVITAAAPNHRTAGTQSVSGWAAYRQEIDEAELIKRHMAGVRRLAGHLKGRLPQSVQLDDLVQAGLIAVLRMARQSNGQPCGQTMLRRCIVNAMIDEARRSAWAPTRAIRNAKAAAAAMQAVRQRRGCEGTDEEIAQEMGLNVDQYHQVLIESAGLSLLDLNSFEEGSEQALQIAADQEEILRQNQTSAALAASVALLPDREKLVVSLYYEHELSMEEVGEVLGLDKSTVSRAHGRALLMLRNAIADWKAVSDRPRRQAGDWRGYSVAGRLGCRVWIDRADDDHRRRQFGFSGPALRPDHRRRRHGGGGAGADAVIGFSARLQNAQLGVFAAAR